MIAKPPVPDFGDTLAVSPQGDSALAIGTRLRDYEITAVIGESDFAIVYIARDHSLQRQVAIKEYFPIAMASRRTDSAALVVGLGRHAEPFAAGLKSFVDEARQLARFDHPSLVKIYRFWEENGTAYMAMPFYEGPTLHAALAELGHVPSEGELRTWLKPILNAVTVLHERQTWHQNIGPDEIVLTPTGPVLLGFGTASRAAGSLGQGPVAALKPGFAALEQYGIDEATAVGPWTDLYALAAVLYEAIAGAPPQPAPERLAADTLQPLAQVAAGLYSAGFLTAIDAALAVRPAERTRDHEQFRARMGDIAAPAPPVSLAPPRDLMQELFLGDAGSHREITVPDRPLLAPTPVPAKATTAAEIKPRPRAEAASAERTPQRTGEPGAPTWMQGGSSRGKRALFGVVAATCACIGVAALAFHFYLRPPARTASPTMPAPAASAALAASAAAPAAIAASSLLPPAVVAPASAAASDAQLAASSASAAAAVAASSAASTATGAASAAAAVPAGQMPRCIEILQKASLEPISAADTEFFKKECK